MKLRDKKRADDKKEPSEVLQAAFRVLRDFGLGAHWFACRDGKPVVDVPHGFVIKGNFDKNLQKHLQQLSSILEGRKCRVSRTKNPGQPLSVREWNKTKRRA